MGTNDVVLAAGRILLVMIYFLGGFALLTGELPVGYAATRGIPAFAVWIGFAIKLLGGLAVIIGLYTRIAAALLIVFTLGTAFIFHPFWVEGEWNTFWKEISMIGGLLVLIATGPGRLSIEGRLAGDAPAR